MPLAQLVAFGVGEAGVVNSRKFLLRKRRQAPLERAGVDIWRKPPGGRVVLRFRIGERRRIAVERVAVEGVNQILDAGCLAGVARLGGAVLGRDEKLVGLDRIHFENVGQRIGLANGLARHVAHVVLGVVSDAKGGDIRARLRVVAQELVRPRADHRLIAELIERLPDRDLSAAIGGLRV